MSKKIYFAKMVASGNDFIILDQRKKSFVNKLKSLAVSICNRKYGIGADGLLILEKSKIADMRMRIFNPDGSEPNMCGNGIRCAAFYVALSHQPSNNSARVMNFETKAGVLNTQVYKNKAEVKVRMAKPKDIKLGLPIKVNKRTIRVNFINTGVPHAVIFVEGMDNIDVVDIGRQIRFHKRFQPQGTNVDFVQLMDERNIKLRTYERGVEDETLACGTGGVAAALIYALRIKQYAIRRINVHTKSGEILKVEFGKINGKFSDVWLQGTAKMVYSGVYYV
jgi:diaminopimelate epimerase